jgi:lon-related putative ATP-dependent protease
MQPDRHSSIVPLDRLRAKCDPNSFTFQNTASLPPPPRMVGQERAAEAIEFGLGVPDSHYNIYVAGPPGSGRSVAAETLVRRVAASLPVPDDWCYVFNFAQQYVPRALALPPGRARPFAGQVDELIEATRQTLRDAFDTDLYRKQRSEALQGIEAERVAIVDRLNAAAAAKGFIIQSGENEPNFLPIKPQTDPAAPLEPYSREEFEALSPEEKQRINANYDEVRALYAAAISAARQLGMRARDALRALDREVAQSVVTPLFATLRQEYAALPAITDYLDAMRDDIIAHAERVRDDDEDDQGGDSSDPTAAATAAPGSLARYKVNVIVDRTGQQGAPYVTAHNPTYYNVAGKLEYGQRAGNLYTDFNFIKAGALHQANGGFLIIHVKEMMAYPKAWDAIKRALRTGEATIENLVDQQQAALLAASLKPEPIPIKVKVVLLGGYEEWDALHTDPDFDELFKVRADFDDEMPRNAQTEQFYAQFAGDVARDLKLPPLDRAAVARVVEEGSRIADNQTRLTGVLTDVRDLVIEAGYWAARSHNAFITVQNVDQATLTRRRREGLFADKYYEQVRQGRQMIAISGSAIGQINALSVIIPLATPIGRVMRITARAAPGLEGVVGIERDAKMSGPIHNKSVDILAGFVAGQFGQERPLSLSATLTFEQVYEPVEGDSASLAELCVLLSALAEIPVEQRLAVTGSVNQWGEVQPVGGVTQKIEGFFYACQANPAPGVRQGVIIPEANVRNLMLGLDVLEAVRQGNFVIHAVRHVADAVELLMNRPAGKRGPDGSYLTGTINALVSEKLNAYADTVRRYRG